MNRNPVRACTHYESPLGRMLLAATDSGLAGVWFVGQRHGPDSDGWPEDASHSLLQQATGQLAEYFAGQRTRFDLPLDLQAGTPFQQSVWAALLAIPPGGTTSYAQLGRQLGRPQAARAIGAAVGRNPVSIVVPCHRVLGTGGGLTGYAGGLERKTALLRLEGALM
ncbi:MAG TPA: methylated-DNA--[protein]-cysteine S-methyltransferase [Ramlibacter sp.]|nr:methylated-DNA--[protein]-cysteine S-methyltransferase [Ramlibacter sp.]